MDAKEIYGKTTARGTQMRYKGVWDMADLYQAMADFFKKRKYKFYEVMNKHKHPSPFGVERQYGWIAVRQAEEFIQWKMYTYMHIYDAHDVEVTMKDGSTHTFTKGRMIFEFRGETVMDWEGRFEDTPFYMQLRNFYYKYIVKKKIVEIDTTQITFEVYRLQTLIKERLDMESRSFEHRHFMGPYRTA